MYAIEYRHDEGGARRFFVAGDFPPGGGTLGARRLTQYPAEATTFDRDQAAAAADALREDGLNPRRFPGNALVGPVKLFD